MTLEEMYSKPGFYFARWQTWRGGHCSLFLETDALLRVHQLSPDTFKRDGLLSREGWGEAMIAIKFLGHFLRDHKQTGQLEEYVLVPTKPTEAILQVMRDCESGTRSLSMEEAWREMLVAAHKETA